MKKLTMMVAFALATSLAQAGAVSWATGNLYMPTSSEDGTFDKTTTVAAGGATVNGYLWVIDAATWQTYYNTYTTDGYSAMSEAIYNAYKGQTGSATKTGATTASSAMMTFVNATSADNKETVYAAMILTMTEDDTDYYIANLGDWVAMSSNSTQNQMGSNELGQRKTTTGYANHGTTTAITGWTVVETIPEPTSGLLLLLGMAGLALRRRRA